MPLPFFLRWAAGFAGFAAVLTTGARTGGSISSSVEGGGESDDSDDESDRLAMVAVVRRLLRAVKMGRLAR